MVAAGLCLAIPAKAQLALPDYYGTYPPPAAAGQWQSTQVFYNAAGRLAYTSDAEGNRIPDFSYAGYHYGEKALPTVPAVTVLSPVNGDNTSRIQSALDAIGSRTPDANGHRGALFLQPGTYEIMGTVRVRQSGVVLRGSGDGTDPANSTILLARGNTPNQRTVVIVGTNTGSPWSTGSAVNITNQFVQVGSMSFNVANASSFSVGQEVVIRHPSSQAWIDAVGGGGVVNSAPWSAGSMDLRWVRRITRIDGTRLFLDAPIFNHLDRSLTQATVAPVTSRNLITEAGVENLRVDIETAGGEDEAHAWNAIGVVGAENSWVRNISARYFGYAGVRTANSIRITVINCRATNPVAIRTGGRMYNFATDAFSQLILFTGCHAGQGRHSFVSNGTTTVSGVVWHRCTMQGGDFEAHRRWSQGLLCDNLRETGTANSQAKLINRGDFGTSHGWGSAHSVIWRFNREMTVQKPPTAQNYAISAEGTRRNNPWFPGPWGSIEIRSGQLVPDSLYEAQLADRLARRPIYIFARHSGRAIVVENGSIADGAAIVQSVTNPSSDNQQWFLAGIGAGFSRVTARHSGKDMLVQGASSADGASVVQAPYLPSAPAHDEWKIEPVSGEYHRIVNRLTGKVIGVTGASTASGASLQQMTWTSALHQQFRFQTGPEIHADSAPPRPPSNLTWVSSASAVWDVAGASNWFNTLQPRIEPFLDGDHVLFGNATSAATNVTVVGTVMPASITNTSATANYSLGGTGKIGGTATVVKQGASTLTLSTSNDFTGLVLVMDGILKVGNAGALGSAQGATIITNAGTLDINGFNLSSEPVIISGSGFEGQGAVINNGPPQITGLKQVTLAGDVTLGGRVRWDIRGGSASLLTGGQPHKITKVGINQISLVDVAPIDPALGDIDVREGIFALQASTSQVGDPGRTIRVFSGATLNLWDLNANPLNKRIVLEDGATFWNQSGNSVVAGPVTLLEGTALFDIGGVSLTVSNSLVSGPGGLEKRGVGVLTLRGVNPYGGPTRVVAGRLALVGTGGIVASPELFVGAGATLDASGRNDGRLTLNTGQQLAGEGTVTGSLTVGPGATVSPGDPLGALAATGPVTLSGTARLTLHKTAGTNSQLRTSATLAYGGALVLTNLGGDLVSGDSFKLFDAPAYTGGFSTVEPSTPGLGLAWNTSQLAVNGVLGVTSAPVQPPGIVAFSISGGDLVISGGNGIDGRPYDILTSTSLLLAFAQWEIVASGVFDGGGAFNVTLPADPGAPQRFYLIRMK